MDGFKFPDMERNSVKRDKDVPRNFAFVDRDERRSVWRRVACNDVPLTFAAAF